jgi:hypothetical protein
MTAYQLAKMVGLPVVADDANLAFCLKVVEDYGRLAQGDSRRLVWVLERAAEDHARKIADAAVERSVAASLQGRRDFDKDSAAQAESRNNDRIDGYTEDFRFLWCLTVLAKRAAVEESAGVIAGVLNAVGKKGKKR